MPDLEDVIRLAMVGSALVEKFALRRFLAGVASVLVLAVIIGSLAAAFLLGGLYLACQALLAEGTSAAASLLITAAAAALLMLGCFFAMRSRLRLLHKSLIPRMSLPSGSSDIAEAFMDGLLTPSEPQERCDA